MIVVLPGQRETALDMFSVPGAGNLSASCQNDPMGAAGILLTGGASRRMGSPKAAISSGRIADGPRLADRTAAILLATTDPVLEVGPGYTELSHVEEAPSGTGPLAALARGAVELGRRGWNGPAVVIATDMPMLDPAVVNWLVGHPAPGSVVPVVATRPQPLCARYSEEDLATAVSLSREGARAMRVLLEAINPALAGPDDWASAGIREEWFADVDDPDDLSDYRLRAE